MVHNESSDDENSDASSIDENLSINSSQRGNSSINAPNAVPRIEGRRWAPMNNQPRRRREDNRTSNNSAQDLQQQRNNTAGNRLEGAPLPRRSIFLSRVSRGDVDSIKLHLEDNNVDVIDITQANHPQAKFKSFKIQITLADVNKVLNYNFWPKGMMVKKWYEKTYRDNSEGNIDYSYDY